MFGTFIRCAVLLIGGSLLMIPFQMVGNALASSVESVGPQDSATVHWIEATVTWFPMLIAAVACLALIAGAAVRRGAW